MTTPSALPGTLQPTVPPDEMPHLDKVRSGYHPSQVHQYVSGLLGRIRELETELAHGVGRAGHALGHEAASPQGQATIAELMKLAADEIQGKQAAAAAEVDQMLKNAAEDVRAQHEQAARQASSTLASADLQATKLVTGAREQADTVLQTAHGQAKKIVDDASAHAAAVHEGAERRARALDEFHQETVRRVREIHRVAGMVLDKDTERGSLDDEVTRLMAAAGVQQEEAGSIPLPPHVNPTLLIAEPEEPAAEAEPEPAAEEAEPEAVPEPEPDLEPVPEPALSAEPEIKGKGQVKKA